MSSIWYDPENTRLARASAAAASIDARDYRIIAGGLVYVVRGAHVVTITTDHRLRWDRELPAQGGVV